jgi:hypothetical protein
LTTWLALDLSLSSTGFALWSSDVERPVIGHRKLADAVKWRAGGFVRLHKLLSELSFEADGIDHIAFEEPLTQAGLKGNTSIETVETQVGLAAHVMSYAAATKATHTAVNISSWRRHFIGAIPRGTKTPDLKAMAMKRARELGMEIACNDESDAFGLLDYFLSVNDIMPPWRNAFCLERQMRPEHDGKRAAT